MENLILKRKKEQGENEKEMRKTFGTRPWEKTLERSREMRKDEGQSVKKEEKHERVQGRNKSKAMDYGQGRKGKRKGESKEGEVENGEMKGREGRGKKEDRK